jgi:hypothetical protein
VSETTTSVVAERAELLHVPDKILTKGLVKPLRVGLDSGALNGDLPFSGGQNSGEH